MPTKKRTTETDKTTEKENPSKEARIEKEYRRLRTSFTAMPKKLKKANEKLMMRAAFMAVTLEDLELDIAENGVTETYQNGANQFGVKKSAAVEVYNSMVRNYMGTIRQLCDCIPVEADRPKIDEFDKFVQGRGS